MSIVVEKSTQYNKIPLADGKIRYVVNVYVRESIVYDPNGDGANESDEQIIQKTLRKSVYNRIFSPLQSLAGAMARLDGAIKSVHLLFPHLNIGGLSFVTKRLLDVYNGDAIEDGFDGWYNPNETDEDDY